MSKSGSISRDTKSIKSGSQSKLNSIGFSNQPYSLHLEVYEEDSLSDTSSDCLQIVTSDNEHGEEKIRKRKRRHSQMEESEAETFFSVEAEIDRQLDAKVAKTNLSVANVKNILKHVITNKHVIEMVRHTLQESEAADKEESGEEDGPYEPKLTRAKTKELLKSQPTITWPITPAKNYTSECQVLIEQELPEDSSDEEYQPNEEDQSDDEKEASASDIDSQAATPQSVIQEQEPEPHTPASNDNSTQTSWTEDGLFRIPQEHIGQRTRSKLSLSDTPLEAIEQAFIPPDITTDMYDSECDDEDWKNFLKDFMKPLTPELNEAVDDDDDADPEYNIPADEEEVDNEELQMDETVEVSRKELDDLVAELFEVSSDDEDQGDLEPLEAVFIPEEAHDEEQQGIKDDVSQNDNYEVLVKLSTEQRLLVSQQMRKHVQLTTQHFLQCYLHPEFSHWAPKCKEMLVCLKCLAGDRINSAFLAENLTAAVALVEDWEERWSTNTAEAQEIVRFIHTEIERGKKKDTNKKITKQNFPKQLLDVICNSEVFLYPLMLPARPFRVGIFQPSFVPSEEQLIAIGLEQFEDYLKNITTDHVTRDLVQICTLIVNYMMPDIPGKDVKKLYDFIRRRRFVKYSPIHYFYHHKQAPPAEHFVIPYNSVMKRPPNKQPIELLPNLWKEVIYHTVSSVKRWYFCE